MSEGEGGALGGSPEMDADDRLRAARIRWLGVVLLFGAFMPVLGVPGAGAFLNFALVFGEGVPPMGRFMAAYPLLAGIAVLIVAAPGMGTVRSVALCVMGLIPLAVLLADSRIGHAFTQILQRKSGINVQFVISLLGSAGVLIGSRMMRYRSWSVIGPVVGSVGGVLTFVCLFVPVDNPAEGLGQMAVSVPFRVIRVLPVMGIGLFAQLACVIAAAALCIVSLFDRPSARTLGGRAFSLWVGAAVAGTVGVPTQVWGAFWRADAGVLLTLLLAFVTLVCWFGSCWFGGLLLLVPVGVTDLIVNLVPVEGAGPEGLGAPPDGPGFSKAGADSSLASGEDPDVERRDRLDEP